MNELLKPLKSEHKQLSDELPVLTKLDEDLNAQATKIDDIERAAEAILVDLKRLAERA